MDGGTSVTDLVLDNNWQQVLQLYASGFQHHWLCWVSPDRAALTRIVASIRNAAVRTVISIGSGSGLLEWLLVQISRETAEEVSLIGLETDQPWWESSYSYGPFIPTVFTEHDPELPFKDEETCLLFCYFNERDAFRDYIRGFSGRALIIIGPSNAERETNPQPFDEELRPHWSISDQIEFELSRDIAVIYIRKEH